MAIAWYIVPYTTILTPNQFPMAIRFLDLSADITWSEIEIDGNQAIVKLDAPENVIAELDQLYKRLPDFNAPISQQRRIEVEEIIKSSGRTQEEINQRFPDGIDTAISRDVLRYITEGGRTKPRFDPRSGTVVFDSPKVPCGDIDRLASLDLTQRHR